MPENEVSYKTGYTHQDSKLYQDNVGAIEVETFLYDHQQKTYKQEVRVWRHNPDARGYGDEIFKGTLEELITKLTIGKEEPDATQKSR